MTDSPLIELCDPTSGSRATILADFGWNAYRFQPMVDDRPLDVIWSPPGFETGTLRPSSGGIPLLFPFGGRIRGAKFSFEGREYHLDPADPRGNAIHGFVHKRPWRVVQQTENRVLGEFQASVDDPTLLAQWPTDFRIRAAHEVLGASLRCTIQVSNPSQSSLPFTLGAHPYFRLPLGEGVERSKCRVTFHARDYWHLEDHMPTGERRPVAGARDLSMGRAYEDIALDDIFTGLKREQGACQAMIEDPIHERTVRLRFSDAFTACVIFTHPPRESICIEPYSGVPDPFFLEERGIQSGLRRLSPGEVWESWFEIHARSTTGTAA